MKKNEMIEVINSLPDDIEVDVDGFTEYVSFITIRDESLGDFLRDSLNEPIENHRDFNEVAAEILAKMVVRRRVKV